MQRLSDAKLACKKAPVPGFRFVVLPEDNKMGVIPPGVEIVGVVIAELSPQGKVQAELTCGVKGCQEKHIREWSDWHQAWKCRLHAKSSGKRLTEQERLQARMARLQEKLQAIQAPQATPTEEEIAA